MKIIRFSLAVLLLCGCASIAKADPIPDFQFSVQDPTGNPTYIDPGVPFAVTFDTCPRNINATGCFFAYNESNVTITSLDISFDNTTSSQDPTDYYNFLNGQPASCSAPGVFANVDECMLSPDGLSYEIGFSGGIGITPGETFVLAETGASPAAFQNGQALAGSATPEPGSLWLLASGAVLMGILVYRQKESWGLGTLR